MVSILSVVANTVAVARNSGLRNRTRLILTYLRLQFKNILMLEILHHRIYRETFFGFTINCFRYEYLVVLFEEIFLTGDYFFSTTTSSPNILDCGSNIGMSILYFKNLYPDARILGFEPDPDTFGMLRRNVEA